MIFKPLTLAFRSNSTYPKGGVSCSKESFVVAESFVLRINICGKKPAHRKSANRLGASVTTDTATIDRQTIKRKK